jgi:hypothetical protein
MYLPQATVYVSFFWPEISEMNMFACGVQNKCPELVDLYIAMMFY